MILCGKARWWDGEIKEKIRLRQLQKEISRGREDKWGEYYKLCSLVRKKKLDGMR